MPARDRSRNLRQTITGSGFDSLGSPQLQFYSVEQGPIQECHDFVGNRNGANGFDMRENDREFPYFHGTWIVGGQIRIKLDRLPAYSMNPEAPDPLTMYGTIGPDTLNQLAWKVLADTNPNKPDVSLPTFIGELKDLPSLVKDWGGDLLKKVAKGHLSWRWAVKPMMGDIRKLCDFSENIERRYRELEHLRDGNGLKRRVGLGSDHQVSSWTSPSAINSNYITVNARSRVTHQMKMWGTVCYKVAPGFTIPRSYSPELLNLARRLTYGITSHELLATAWELTPWSWFADWFLNIGNSIAASNNTVPLVRTRPCVMRSLSAEKEFEITNLPTPLFSYTGRPHGKRTRKERYVVAPTLPFSLSLPLFDGGKWSVLASLAALRRK